jgi:arabinofuranosyltransferase
MENNRRIFVIALFVAFLIYALLAIYFNWTSDDAFISFRYAKNLAEGEGLRYNIGEDPPVEGYSNFLWVLLMAPLELIGIAPSIASRIISFLCGMVLLWRLIRFLSVKLSIAKPEVVAAAVFFATLPPMLIWATSGLATMPFTLLLFLAFEALLANPDNINARLGAVSCSLLILLRAEGFAWVIVCVAIAALAALVQKNRRALKPLLICGAISLVILIALIVFRVIYFHDFLPNTVYAKATMSPTILLRGVNYTISFFLYFPHLVLIALAAIPAAGDGKTRYIALHALLLILAATAYSILVGGDFMAMGRFFVPVMPFFAVLFAVVLSRVTRPAVAAPLLFAVAVAVSLLPLFNVTIVPRSAIDRFHFRWTLRVENSRSEIEQWRFMVRNGEGWARIGKAMKRYTNEGESYVATAIGAVGYYSGLYIYDSCGLVDRDVGRRVIEADVRVSPGHDKFVPVNYFLKYHPTYISASIEDGEGVERMRSILERIGLEEYELRTHPLESAESPTKQEYLCLFARKQS